MRRYDAEEERDGAGEGGEDVRQNEYAVEETLLAQEHLFSLYSLTTRLL